MSWFSLGSFVFMLVSSTFLSKLTVGAHGKASYHRFLMLLVISISFALFFLTSFMSSFGEFNNIGSVFEIISVICVLIFAMVLLKQEVFGDGK